MRTATTAGSGAGGPAGGAGFTCLAVDDDAGFLSMIERVIRDEGGVPVLCPNLQAARRQLAERSFDLILLDNGLPDGTGYDFFNELGRRGVSGIVIMITGAPELGQAVALTRNGLFDYLTKPLNLDDFAASLRRARLRMSRAGAPDAVEMAIVGDSGVLKAVTQTLRQAARHPEAAVLILGETGTGKDLAARMLHQWTYEGRSPLPPYVALNCSTVPGEMFEAELFGSEKGAYTGADKRRTGLIEAAEGGTLFLDEVGEIPLVQQAKLLRFLENREYRPLGSTSVRQFTGRIVAATNRPLEEEVRQGRFREDLLFRLDVLSVRIPPLRERAGDLEPLAEHLLAGLCEKYQRAKPYLRPDDLQVLRAYSFPGNVRELRNLLERSLLKSPPESRWLPLELSWLRGPSTSGTVPPASVGPAAATPPGVPSGIETRPGAAVSGPAPAPPVLPPGRELSPIEFQEYALIEKTLREERGAIRRAAARLGLTHQALLRRLQKWPELREAGGGKPASVGSGAIR